MMTNFPLKATLTVAIAALSVSSVVQAQQYGVVENVLFNDYGWTPAHDSYNLPYTSDDISDMSEFDIDKYVGDD